MALTDEQLAALGAPLDRAAVKTREGKFSYIEGHHCIREANRIFGFGRWRRETLRCEPVREVTDYKQMKDGQPTGQLGYYVAYVAQVRIHVWTGEEWVATDGVGYGESVTYLQAEGQAHESASKEAETDAMKRALICWGDQFGLALYDRDQAHVEGAAARTGGGVRHGQESAAAGVVCPKCGRAMTQRTAKSGAHAGETFWGCTGYPECKGILTLAEGLAQVTPAPPPVATDPDNDPFADQ
jgi:hypothetical protein